MFWNPSPALSGILIYTGDRFPTWKGNIFIGTLGGRNLGARQPAPHRVEREGTCRSAPATRRSWAGLEQRIRDVKQGPDGLLYLTTDERSGAILRIEPVE